MSHVFRWLESYTFVSFVLEREDLAEERTRVTDGRLRVLRDPSVRPRCYFITGALRAVLPHRTFFTDHLTNGNFYKTKICVSFFVKIPHNEDELMSNLIRNREWRVIVLGNQVYRLPRWERCLLISLNFFLQVFWGIRLPKSPSQISNYFSRTITFRPRPSKALQFCSKL